MDDEERGFEKRKKSLVLKLMHVLFEEACADYIREGKWGAINELDGWLDEKLKEHDDICDEIKRYYDSKIYN